jgi:protein TonB
LIKRAKGRKMAGMKNLILALALVTPPALAEALPASPVTTIDQAATSSHGSVIVPAVRAQQRANLASYIQADDYPPTAMRANQQGQVTFLMAIGPDGRLTDCIVTGSSGSAELDSATCRIMKSRARFTPARDAHGNPNGDLQSGLIRWSLP